MEAQPLVWVSHSLPAGWMPPFHVTSTKRPTGLVQGTRRRTEPADKSQALRLRYNRHWNRYIFLEWKMAINTKAGMMTETAINWPHAFSLANHWWHYFTIYFPQASATNEYLYHRILAPIWRIPFFMWYRRSCRLIGRCGVLHSNQIYQDTNFNDRALP